jgi:hypothetical protein
MAKRSYHVIPSDSGGWEVRREDARRSTRHFTRKTEAVEYGRQLATRAGSELVEHAKSGKIRGIDTPQGYGSLKGEFMTRRGIDLTKPIHLQAQKGPVKRY